MQRVAEHHVLTAVGATAAYALYVYFGGVA